MSASAEGLFTAEGALIAALLLLPVLGIVDPIISVQSGVAVFRA